MSGAQPELFTLPRPENMPVQLKWGGGVDSTTIIWRWLTEPHTRDFPLEDLHVVIALVGAHDEYERTAELARLHVLPLLARHRVMTYQVGRASDEVGDGYRVLEATRSPTVLRRELTSWSYYEYCLRRGIVPNTAGRACSDTAKHFALDRFAADLSGGRPYRSVIGFEVDEWKRADKDLERATALRFPEHPLMQWGYDRRTCLDYLAAATGVRKYARSCCSFCPYQRSDKGLPALVERWREEPAAAARALYLEFVAMCMHPLMKLFKKHSAIDLAREHRLTGALEIFDAMLAETEWRVYEVRRFYPLKTGTADEKGKAWRSVRALTPPDTRARAAGELAALAAAEGKPVEVDHFGIARATLIPRPESYPGRERTWVTAPAVVADKQRDSFDDRYNLLDPDGTGLERLAEIAEVTGLARI